MKLNLIWTALAIAVIAVISGAYFLISAAHTSTLPTKQQSIGDQVHAPSNVIFGATSPYVNFSDLKTARSYGLTFIRTDVAFTPDFNAFVSNVSDSGYQILGILDYDTVGASITSNGCDANCNWTLADWNASVAEAIDAYPQIHYWEIWNEPQFPIFQDGYQNGNPYNYSVMLKSAYKIIKAHDPSDTVVCMGGDNVFVYSGNLTLDDFLWAEQLWSYNASDYCNIVSLHVYSDGAPLNYTIPNTNLTVGTVIDSNLNAYENLTKKPIWITEMGIPLNIGAPITNGPLYQEQFLNQSFQIALSKSYVTGVFWFDLAIYPFNASKSNYGLFNGSNFDPYPSALALEHFTK